MTLETFMTGASTVVSGFLMFLAGRVHGRMAQREDDADEAVSDNPALWWREQIELAKGRKAARGLRKDGAR